MTPEPATYPGHRFPAEIISHAVGLYHVWHWQVIGTRHDSDAQISFLIRGLRCFITPKDLTHGLTQSCVRRSRQFGVERSALG
jgi:hypothetical protein